ncbi:MAG: enoyl-CoA hydratase/isomerase family protein [Chloroflexota bacterium]|nr:enoyl-CoA hydratase/isomerase family protein [Chloroflexota bacterium]
MAEAAVISAREGGIARLTLNKPDRRNALDPELAGALVAAIEQASGDPGVRVIVLTGAGTAFCAGAKLDGLLDASERGDSTTVAATFGAVEDVYRSLLAARPPTIAAVNGHALAGGAGLATLCDFAIASDRAQFGYPEVLLGLAPGMVMAVLFRLVGYRVGLELALTGRRVPADEAARIGLVNAVVGPDELEAAVLKLADQLAALSPSALALTKRWARALGEMDLATAIRQGRDVSTLAALTPDARAGIGAFLHRSAR